MRIFDQNWMQVEANLARETRAVLPLGSTEQHAHLSLGTDAILAERVAVEAAEPLGVPVFPALAYGISPYFGAYPGSVSLRVDTYLSVVRDVLDSLARSGFRRILIVNGHGGNNSLLQYFTHMQIEHARGYVVYSFSNQGLGMPSGAAAPSKPGADGHAGEGEISNIMASRPGLAHPERAGTESGSDQKRLDLPEGVSTGITWYSRFPNHYQGDAAGATEARGQASLKILSGRIANAIRAIKADETTLRLQTEFQDAERRPLATRQ